MKNIFKIVLAVMLCFCMVSCAKAPEKNLWETAIYTEDATLGEGAKTIQLEVIAKEKSVTFTVNTDKETLGDALAEHKLISGEKGVYGLYVKVVNGIKADYDEDKSFWAFTKNGENMYVLKNTQTPGALIECGFLTNSEECLKLSSKEYQKALSFSIVCGIIEYMNSN